MFESIQQRYNLITSFAEEIVNKDILERLLFRGVPLVCYDGMEPSGKIHIAQAVMRANTVNALTSAGCKFIFLVADYFAFLNHKMGGDLQKIQDCGKYMIEVWKSCGMNMENVEFRWSSQEVNQDYFARVMDVSTKFSIDRIRRCCTALGKEEDDENLSASQIFYPVMQCADIFHLGVNICSLGMDQRKINMLAVEYSDKAKLQKPVILSHHMLLGLDGTKMSKSNPDNAIFMDDPTNLIFKKIKKAFCPEKVIDGNPVMEYAKYIIFPKDNKLEIIRDPKWGSNQTYSNYSDLCKDYTEGIIHPGDLKNSVAKAIDAIVDNTRQYFAKNYDAALIKDTVEEHILELKKKK